MKTPSLGPLAPGPDCNQFADLLPLLNTAELAEARGAEARAHVALCRWCRQQLKEYTALEAALRRHIASLSAGFPAVSPEGVIDSVERQETMAAPPAPRAEAPRRPARRFVSWMAPSAAVLVVILLTVAIFVSRGSPSSSAPPNIVSPGTPSALPSGIPSPSGTPSPVGRIPGVLYAITNESGDVSRVLALRRGDGKVLWRSKQSGAFSNLVSDQGRVYVLLGDSESVSVLALSASDGSVLWQSQPQKVEFEPTLTAANGVVYFENSVYHKGDQGDPVITVAPAITAFRGSDGHTLWRYAAPDQMMSPPAVFGSSMYVGVGAGVVALRVSDGTQRWRAPLGLEGLPYLEGLGVDGSGVYAFVDERILAPSRDDIIPHLFALRASDGGPLWRFDPTQDAVSAPVVAGGVVYLGTGGYCDSSGLTCIDVLYALRAKDGKQLWRYETPSFTPIIAPWSLAGPLLANGVLYFVSGDGLLNALRASDQKLLWHQRLDNPGLTPILALTDQAIFVQTDASVLALWTSDGSVIWQQ
ncbi:MAG TPA: PQQ-binding-like beta-propeller repeat protein [Ktedonobacterales bacterium]|jgi:outer membrane protein assembly factor BamB